MMENISSLKEEALKFIESIYDGAVAEIINLRISEEGVYFAVQVKWFECKWAPGISWCCVLHKMLGRAFRMIFYGDLVNATDLMRRLHRDAQRRARDSDSHFYCQGL